MLQPIASRRTRTTSLAPLLSVIAGMSVLALGLGEAVLKQDDQAVNVTIMGAALLLLGYAIKSLHSSQRKLTQAAASDPLTGMPNRRQLMSDFEWVTSDEAARGEYVLALLDLDGFKGYNDVFGHPAGDVLLTRLGSSLVAEIEPTGNAYRMGGDEFCVLAPIEAESAEAIAERATAALAIQGEGFEVSASCGWVLVPSEAVDKAEALRIADQRLYAQKNTSRVSVERQTAAALLKVLEERDPRLGTHLGDVTELCEAVARKLYIPEETIVPLLQAASLHDIGKVAIPDEILSKPGPLDAEEWEFIHRHTVIGERILSAAAALSWVARIVRSTHERFDGRGYPDGLAGDDIPLGARVISVCDAFDAMTSDRPYRRGMSAEKAIYELRNCSGSQFDPVVVDALCSVFAERRPDRSGDELARVAV